MENEALVPAVPRFADPREFVHDPEGYARFVISRIPEMTEEDLDLTARQAFRIESAGFVIRIFCVARLLKLTVAKAGGRGNKDEEGKGITATLRKLAEQWQLDVRTLQTDRAIYKEFFEGQSETCGVNATGFGGLGREYFRIALSAASPKAAIKIAVEKRKAGPYSVRQFADDVRDMPRSAAEKSAIF